VSVEQQQYKTAMKHSLWPKQSTLKFASSRILSYMPGQE